MCVSLLQLQTEGRFPNCLSSLHHHYRYCVQIWPLVSSFVRIQWSWPTSHSGSHVVRSVGVERLPEMWLNTVAFALRMAKIIEILVGLVRQAMMGKKCVWWMLSLSAVMGREKAALALRVQVRLLGKAILGEDASSIKGAGMNRNA